MKLVLFLCSANFYRSRFAEHVFNWLAGQEGLQWKADSRGLAVGHWGDLGAISHLAIEALGDRGIPIDGEHRFPQALTSADLANADLVIALKEAEHRSMMAKQFPLWKDRIEYWHVDDLDCAARGGPAGPGTGSSRSRCPPARYRGNGRVIDGRAVLALGMNELCTGRSGTRFGWQDCKPRAPFLRACHPATAAPTATP